MFHEKNNHFHPVSYTHLDVYKRQVLDQYGDENTASVNQDGLFNGNYALQWGNKNVANINQVGVMNTNESYSVGNRNEVMVDQYGWFNGSFIIQQGNRNSADVTQFGIGTVSYTHLDVYKRQL